MPRGRAAAPRATATLLRLARRPRWTTFPLVRLSCFWRFLSAVTSSNSALWQHSTNAAAASRHRTSRSHGPLPACCCRLPACLPAWPVCYLLSSRLSDSPSLFDFLCQILPASADRTRYPATALRKGHRHPRRSTTWRLLMHCWLRHHRPRPQCGHAA